MYVRETFQALVNIILPNNVVEHAHIDNAIHLQSLLIPNILDEEGINLEDDRESDGENNEVDGVMLSESEGSTSDCDSDSDFESLISTFNGS